MSEDGSFGGGGDFGGGGGDYTETTTESWFSRIGNAIKGVLIGLLLFVVSFPLLFWNEFNAVAEAGGIAEGKRVIVSVSPDKVDPANDKKLVHMSGTATTEETLKDDVFGVEKKALRLKRVSEIYQYKEYDDPKQEKQTGGQMKTVHYYSYKEEWVDAPIDSSKFHKEDKKNLNAGSGSREFSDETKTAGKITVGAFTLSPDLVSHIPSGSVLAASTIGVDKMSAQVKEKWKPAGEYFYRGEDPNKPKVGDQRVKFIETAPQPVSLYAQQTGDSFQPYVTQTKSTLTYLKPGTESAEEMLRAAQGRADTMTWILRLVGFLLMAFGVFLIFQPFVVFADVLPIFGNFLSMGVVLFAVLVALPLTLLTIAIAWISSRPILGIGLLVAVAALFGLLFYLRRPAKSRIAKPAPKPS